MGIVGMLRGNTYIVRTLLGCSNIRIDIKDSYGWTALHCAANNDKVESVKLFLAHPACNKEIVKIENNDGMTAEMMAEEEGNQECARLIREYLENNDNEENIDEIDEQPILDNMTDDAKRVQEMNAYKSLMKTTMTSKRKTLRKLRLRSRTPIYQCTNNARKSLLILLLLLLVPFFSILLHL